MARANSAVRKVVRYASADETLPLDEALAERYMRPKSHDAEETQRDDRLDDGEARPIQPH